MSQRDAVLSARGHIAWILALILSSGVIFWLEATGMGGWRAGGEDTVAQEAAHSELDAARIAHASDPDDSRAQARLLIALSLTLLDGQTGQGLEDEARALMVQMQGADDELTSAAIQLAESVFVLR